MYECFEETFYDLLHGTQATLNILLLSRAVGIVAVNSSVGEANDTPRSTAATVAAAAENIIIWPN
jgi:hypothetical protein